MAEYVLFKRTQEHVRSPYDADTMLEEVSPIPESLVDALRKATPEQLQEIADAAVCLMAGLRTLEPVSVVGKMEYKAVMPSGQSAYGDTRAEALQALVKAVKGENPK